ncbi:hypothetical protein VD0004_g8201 [Verticillium dahliae]|uniref:Uncharacterized protein n=3 Tax=Verticillium dahliae TaxID=27337 RepID=G2X861_VERDV|nr:uncharacterized protein VDAG_06002 [Verticillium dahliae VdLs.17]KAF3342418.1 Levodione reductase [Verticillium dahliae VDG2]PNH36021.1 hypothetical protein BJF96_g755 [Verticillium dahliae]EGY15148.1 hypothetical protein VDAG_06002 [Verticillium dahliae VdLs.17]PNH38627.1 hypothetical protein VD0004_g8201 [Verticillium dahliae]PNH48697.1 hypothetical protein VD0003_g8428 [Verticillium dahliae]
MPFSTEGMPPAVLDELLNRLGRLLSHVSYSVRGLAALSFYGLTTRLPSQVSIACPLYARDVIKCWAAAQGMIVHPSLPDCFGVPLSDGSIRKVRLQFVDAGAPLDWIAMGPAETRIASMPALLDTLAERYMDPKVPAKALSTLGRDIFWLLQRMAEDGSPEQVVTAERVPNVLKADFWSLFTFTHYGADQLLYDAGFGKLIAELDRPVSEAHDSLLDDSHIGIDCNPEYWYDDMDAGLAESMIGSGRPVPPLRRKDSRYFERLSGTRPATVELAFVESSRLSSRDHQSPLSAAELDQMAEQGIMFCPVDQGNW